LESGNQPILVDIDPNTGNLSIEGLKTAKNSLPAAIIPCHMYGLGAPMTSICQWAREKGAVVIEDAALAIGGIVEDRPAGSWGDVSIFSFGLEKIVDVEVGGAVLTDDAALAKEIAQVLESVPLWDERLAAMTAQWNSLYWALHQYETDNPRLLSLYPQLFDLYRDLVVYRLPDRYWDDLPAALTELPANLAHRAHLAAICDELLADLPVRTLPRPEGSILWRYPLLVPAENRDDLLNHLWSNGVRDATRWYPALGHMRAALAPDLLSQETPNADRFAAEIVNLTVDRSVEEGDARRVMALIRNYFADS
jgi:dTDP-4-amino-4,6-dideoxygalactose transaminase